jgi:hypothetical protein
MPPPPVFPVRFDEAAFDEDLLHVTPRGRTAAIEQRQMIERDGIPANELIACDSLGADGTRLGGCVKTRLPWPDGPWGLVLAGQLHEGRVYLQVIAFGERHPTAAWRPSVYLIADRRLHPTE